MPDSRRTPIYSADPISAAAALPAGAADPGGRLPLERFDAIGLGELVAEAELLSRVDRKYLVPLEVATRILDAADPASRVLEIDGTREFAYDSVYFDTPERTSYRLTAQRRRRRFKLRTRGYLDTGAAFLELKTKSGRGSTVKERIAYDPADRGRLTETGAAYAAQLLGEQGHDPSLVRRLRPMLVSRYRRATLLMPDGSRVTVDTALHWSGDDGRALELPRYAIVESKSAGAPSALDRALWRSGHRPSGISKFGTGTAALHPELPANKWARALRGPFAEAKRCAPQQAPELYMPPEAFGSAPGAATATGAGAATATGAGAATEALFDPRRLASADPPGHRSARARHPPA